MDSGTLIAIALGTVLLAMVWSISKGKSELFTIHKVEEQPCIQPVKQVDDDLLPHSLLLIISGYNYTQNPKIYRDDKPIVPLKFARDYVEMLYYYTVECPLCTTTLDGCKHSWIVETYDFVKPVVYNGREAKEFKVELLERASGKYKWSVEC